MVVLRDHAGIPLRDVINLPPQQLYDLFRSFGSGEQLEDLDHLIIIDDETGDALKEHLRRTVERHRPENRGVAHNVAIEARSVALGKCGLEVGSAISLTELENRLWAVMQEPAVVFEDADFAACGVEMNRIISLRPHGRASSLD